MLRSILRLQTHSHPSFLSCSILTLLLTIAGITAGVPFDTRADTNPLLFRETDLKDLGSFAVKLQDARAPISQHIATQLPAETQQLLSEYDGISNPSPTLQKALLTDLNRLLQADSIYDAQSFADIELTEQTQKLLAQNPQSEETGVRLNRRLLSDAYPHELASPSEKRNPEDSSEIEICRENLRQIKLALENHRAKANAALQWLSELSPEYLEKKMLCCPADPTAGAPGVLTEGASDPTLPCSYLYELRPDKKAGQEFLLEIEGDMIPLVRCQHHLLNLSVSGKLYRFGPQRNIYNSDSSVKTIRGVPQQQLFRVDSPADLESLRNVLGDAFFETQDGKGLIENLTEKPDGSGDSQAPNLADTPQSITSSSQQLFQVRSPEDLASLRSLLGDAFFETQDGKALLKHVAALPSTSKNTEAQQLIGAPFPDVKFRNLSGESVKLEQFRGRFVLLNLFSADSTASGPDLQRLETLLANTDATRLQAIRISMDSQEATAAFQEKYQIAMPVWIVEKSEMLEILNKDTTQSQTKRITILLNPELVVEAVFTDMRSLLQKVKEFTELKAE